MQNFFISDDEIIKPINNLKDRITRTPDNIHSFFIKRTVYFIIFPKSLIFNCSLATSSVPKQWKISYVILIKDSVNFFLCLLKLLTRVVISRNLKPNFSFHETKVEGGLPL